MLNASLTHFLAVVAHSEGDEEKKCMCGVRRQTHSRLVTVSLDLHSSSDTRDGFLSGEIGNVDESVVEAEPRCQYKDPRQAV